MKRNIETTTSVMMTQAVCKYPLLPGLYSLSKKLVFMPVASAATGGHRDCLFLDSFAQQPEIQHPVSRGQIISADLP